MKEGREVGLTAMDLADAAALSGVSALHARCFSTPGAEGGLPVRGVAAMVAGAARTFPGLWYRRAALVSSPGVPSLGDLPLGLNRKR